MCKQTWVRDTWTFYPSENIRLARHNQTYHRYGESDSRWVLQGSLVNQLYVCWIYIQIKTTRKLRIHILKKTIITEFGFHFRLFKQPGSCEAYLGTMSWSRGCACHTLDMGMSVVHNTYPNSIHEDKTIYVDFFCIKIYI